MDYYAMPATMITTNAGDWTVILHLLFWLQARQHFLPVSIGTTHGNQCRIRINAESGLFSITEDLPDDQNHFFIPAADFPEKCVKVLYKIVCSDIVIYMDNDVSCLSSLFSNTPNSDVLCTITADEFKAVKY